ncbi:MAG: prolipoprotein diacylglyceryl transferase family protein [Myxococcota bacterium]
MKPLIPWFEAPVLNIPIGDFVLPLHGFGLLVALGFIFGGRAAMGRAKRLGMDPEVINRLIGWLVFGTFVGGHVGYGLMYKPQEYLSNPIEFLKVWQGLSSFGGFVTCVPIAIWFFRSEKAPLWPYLDCLAYGMGVGWFFGRMGCFVAHDHPGTQTDFYLGVYGICQPGQNKLIACHDLGLYEGLWALSMFGLFTVLDRMAWKAGTFTLMLGLAYGPLRFTMDFFRPEVTDARYLGFTPGQYWSTVLTIVCLGALVVRLRSSDAPIGPARGASEPNPSLA